MKEILLTTGRLILRELAESDLPGIYEYAQDPEVFRYQDWGPFNENETRAHLQMMMGYRKDNPRVHYELAVVLKANAQVIGNCGIHISNPANREGWIDCFLNRHYWNQSYAPEAVLNLLELAFKDLKLHRVFAYCAPDNPGAERALIKAGLKREGYLQKHKMVRGQWQDALLYAILESEWKGKSAEPELS
jgi:[ribosomal protein S5]-alanine N-acetyltransferase